MLDHFKPHKVDNHVIVFGLSLSLPGRLGQVTPCYFLCDSGLLVLRMGSCGSFYDLYWSMGVEVSRTG